ncbi:MULTISPECIES: hypothetical protein [Streptomyces]|nr:MULTISPECIES: hypothetical protein [Streptomyces]
MVVRVMRVVMPARVTLWCGATGIVLVNREHVNEVQARLLEAHLNEPEA